MADDLNSLLQANRSSSVLQGIANPAQVNPLAAMTSAAQTAGSIYGVRKLQAQQVAGQLATESIDPVTKQFDPAVYNTKIAAAGPSVAMYAQPALQDASTLSQTQLAQQHAKAGYIQGVIGALDDNSTPGQVNGALDRAAANGMFTPTDIANMRAHVPTNQADMPAFIQQLRLVGGSVQQQLEQKYGTNFRENTGSAIVGGTQQPAARGGGINTAGGGIQLGLTPAELSAQSSIRDPRRTLPDGSANPDYQKPKLFTRQEQLEMNGFKIGPNGEVYPPGQAPPGQGGIPGTGRYNIPSAISGNTNQPAPATPAPATPAAGVVHGNPATPQAVPAPPGGPPGASTAPYTGSGMGGVLGAPAPRPGASLAGGVPVASTTNALQPNVGPAAPPSPAVAGDVAAIMGGMQRGSVPVAGTAAAGPAAQAPQGGFGAGVGSYGGSPAKTPPAAPTAPASPFDRPAVGPSPGEEEQAKTAGGKFDTEATVGVQAQAQQAILGNMLADTKQFQPGPYAETIKNWRSRLAPLFNVDEKALAGADSFDKLAAQLASAQGSRSDANLSIATAANPHPGQSAAGVDFVLRQLQGNADYLQARQKLAEKWPSKSDYNGFLESTRQLDPRVFQYERLTDNQKQDYFKALEPKDRAAFKTAHGWAEQRGLVAPPGS